MLLKPSQSLSALEQCRARIKKVIERLRGVYATIQENGFTAKDYVDYYNRTFKQDIKVPETFDVSYGHLYSWDNETTWRWLDECEKESKLLNALNKKSLKQKPSEETMASVRNTFICHSRPFVPETRYFAMDLDKELETCNTEINKFKRVCETLIKYRVSDGEYMKLYSGLSDYTYLKMGQYISKKDRLDEALDLVNVIEANYGDYKPYTKKWIFRIPTPMDEHLKDLLNGLLVRYTHILN